MSVMRRSPPLPSAGAPPAHRGAAPVRVTRRRALGLLALAATTPLVVACGEANPATADVTLMLDWVPNTNHTGFYVARANGYFAAERLNVSIVEPGSVGVEQAVASGAVQFGVSFQENVTQARVKDVPVVSVAAIIQHNTSGFASPEDRKIRRPRDFAGKKYGAFGVESERQVLAALMQCDGGDFSEIEFVDIGATDPFVAWQRGDVDFIWIFEGWTGIEAVQRGVALSYIRLTDFACIPDYYTPVLITGETLMRENRDLVQRFVRAAARGYEFAIARPAEAAEILIAAAEGVNRDLVRASQIWLSPRYAQDAARWGEQTSSRWAAYADWMFQHKLIGRAINPATAFTNEFIAAWR